MNEDWLEVSRRGGTKDFTFALNGPTHCHTTRRVGERAPCYSHEHHGAVASWPVSVAAVAPCCIALRSAYMYTLNEAGEDDRRQRRHNTQPTTQPLASIRLTGASERARGTDDWPWAEIEKSTLSFKCTGGREKDGHRREDKRDNREEERRSCRRGRDRGAAHETARERGGRQVERESA